MNAHERQLSALEPLELRYLPDAGLSFDEPLPAAWLRATLDEGRTKGLTFEVVDDGRVRVTVVPLGPVDERPPIQVRGRVEATVQTDCVRCLEPVRPPIDAEVELTLLPAPERPTEAEPEPKRKGRKLDGENGRVEDWTDEAFPSPDALAEATYAGARLDLPGILREALLLGLSTHPVCEAVADCDARTAALIDEANEAARAAETAVDPRWAALKKLRDGVEPS